MRVLLPLTLTLLTGAAGAAGYPVTVTHTSGQTTLRAEPRRAVALGPHALDLLLSLGVQPVGYGEASHIATRDYGSPIRQIRYLGSRVTGAPINVGDRFNPNQEVLLSVKPDLIVGENYAAANYPALTRLAPTLLFHGIHSGDWQKSIVTLGRALNREPQARAVLNRHATFIRRAAQDVPAPLRGARALVVWNAGGPQRDVFTVLGPRDWTGGFFQSLGFRLTLPGSADPGLGEGYRKVSSEALAGLDADVVFLIASSRNTTAQARRDWQANPLAQRLNASRSGRVYVLDAQLFSRLRGPIAEELMVRELQRQWKP
ncbi:ABC transporter substrate-binding protein [Deinococcus sp. RIT780]|uniref:ABC transporter substrate-binding protein n=1 Tax=Deinococcus sp. RIT780 TaxID=2870472 RepID=UPI001C894214|nr:iron-siderophore ABC transporter substrate-binding protein [Deinococcus sp. RIT780]MBX8466289.1 iron-siderophore ABC transporter substrate-binding protein [Deinococcus sp. RIT780]